MDDISKEKLAILNNSFVNEIIQRYAKLSKPSKITVLDDSPEDLDYVRKLSLENGEESSLSMTGHTIHFDSPKDQGRDLVNTRVLVKPGEKLGKAIKTLDREEGLKEVLSLLDGIMKGKEMLVKFYCLGPVGSEYAIPALQITDSAYVLHSEDILYRQGYEQFKNLRGADGFFHFIHSAGKLEDHKSVDIDKRRVYMDLDELRAFTVNNQYAGNSVGLKKMALRLAISKAHKEGWLCEHMFIMGAKNPKKNRVTYFTGAFPSACGKTSTAMIPGQSIIGDDIAYIRPKGGVGRAVNVEQGVFGIIRDVNPEDDALIYKVLTSPRELILSNVLISADTPYWLGMGKELPESGKNYLGNWKKGMTDSEGKEILAAHKNARYAVRIKELENCDPALHDTEGVPVSGFIYGGRDSDTSVPVLQSYTWAHGVFIGAALESETTAAAIGKEGVRKHNPMSNVEFLTVPLSTYIKSHLSFREQLRTPPRIFATNYFLKKDGEFLNAKVDKKVWLMWMEGRVHNEFDGVVTPVGVIPQYEDLKSLFKEFLDKEYTKEEYVAQFSIQCDKYLAKLDRIEAIFRDEENIPDTFFMQLYQQRQRLKGAMIVYEKEVISPFEFAMTPEQQMMKVKA